jgi:chromatin segregation and condensation protein Rec8/ScpA/Scc1 (kleisin family)
MPPAPALPPPPLTLNLLDMITAVERVIAGIPSPVLHKVVARPLDVESATRRIEDLLRDQEQIHWIDALGPGATIVDVLSTLLALLELAKRGSLRLLQPTPFSPLVIARESALATA